MCRMLGLDCQTADDQSGGFCHNCLQANHASILSYRLCMRDVPLEEISIFLPGFPNASDHSSFWNGRPNLNLDNISLEFEVTWTFSSIIADVEAFLASRSIRLTSLVGTLCSRGFLQLLQGDITPTVAHRFQTMLYSASFCYGHAHQSLYDEDMPMATLQQLGNRAGHDFLRFLDKNLNASQLATATLDKLRALFLVLFGTILAIGYTREHNGGQSLAADATNQPLWFSMQEHLCEVLAHYLVLVGKRINVTFGSEEERRLLRRPLNRWDQKGTHSWIKRKCSPSIPEPKPISIRPLHCPSPVVINDIPVRYYPEEYKNAVRFIDVWGCGIV
ncbi:hypothetical protein CEP52_002288 [Fusarium oligoseptatum]|uniref:Uncharacterized protein n=1 Tax=Fusarium oligoseptatum TaxID=2604345 RepID=A0A428UE78_9HYPO|nr:hypothetical protein CEP52_002288 [Fusarium oligoseptatum]